jgi:predicted nucleotidyltransferase
MSLLMLYNSEMINDLPFPDDLKKDISAASEILLREGCTEIYIFGSIAQGSFTNESDIDIAAVGLPKNRFFVAYGLLLSQIHRPVDLVALDYDSDFGRILIERGLLRRVA